MFSLKPGDKVGIISPSSFIEAGSAEMGIAYLEEFGLQAVPSAHIYSAYRYMGGTDAERAADINGFFKNPDIKAIFCTRGGAGSARLLPYLDYEIIRNNPKPVFGLSDSTALQNSLFTQTGNISYTGFLLNYDLKSGHIDGMVDQSFKAVISGKPVSYTGGETAVKGSAEGTLIGGNLTTFARMGGTAYFPPLQDSILLLEDIGCKSYQLDLMLEQLRQMPDFEKVRGIIFGAFTNIQVFDSEDGTVEENINYFCEKLTIPVLKNFPYGHIPSRHILPLGAKIKLNANTCMVEF